jgi:hypothetical protein
MIPTTGPLSAYENTPPVSDTESEGISEEEEEKGQIVRICTCQYICRACSDSLKVLLDNLNERENRIKIKEAEINLKDEVMLIDARMVIERSMKLDLKAKEFKSWQDELILRERRLEIKNLYFSEGFRSGAR